MHLYTNMCTFVLTISDEVNGAYKKHLELKHGILYTQNSKPYDPQQNGGAENKVKNSKQWIQMAYNNSTIKPDAKKMCELINDRALNTEINRAKYGDRSTAIKRIKEYGDHVHSVNEKISLF